MKLSRYIILDVVLTVLTACEKEIEFEYHDIPEQQVIEGMLSQKDVRVRLTKTIAIDEPFNHNTMTDATVTVTDKTSGRTFFLTPDDTGTFINVDLTGQTGHEYELTVSIGTDRYTSTSKMSAPSEIVSAEFNWIKMPYDDVAVLKVLFTEDKDATTSYWLRVYRNGEPYQWQTISSHNAVDGLVRGLMMTSRKDIGKEEDDTVLREGDIIDIEVMPVAKVMADYLNSLNNGDFNGYQMFSGSYCLGYFLAAPVSRTQLTYHPDKIPYDN